MPIYRYLLALLVFLSSLSFAIAQQNQSDSFKALEDSCILYYKQTTAEIPDSDKIIANTKFSQKLRIFLETPGSFNYALDSLKSVGRLYTPDKNFRIITWNIRFEDGSYRYFGLIQFGKSNKIIELSDHHDEITNPENSVLSAGKWFGCLYYKALMQKADNRTYYTLLAVRYHNSAITEKMVDILFFNEYDKPVFGAPIIQSGNKFKHRLVFDYSAFATVNLRYDEQLKMIIFDHVAAADPKYNGQIEYYGPDLTFDGLSFQKGRWMYKANLDLRQPFDPAPKRKPPLR